MLLTDGTYVRLERIATLTPSGRPSERALLTFARPDGGVITLPLAAPDLTTLAEGLLRAWREQTRA